MKLNVEVESVTVYINPSSSDLIYIHIKNGTEILEKVMDKDIANFNNLTLYLSVAKGYGEKVINELGLTVTNIVSG